MIDDVRAYVRRSDRYAIFIAVIVFYMLVPIFHQLMPSWLGVPTFSTRDLVVLDFFLNSTIFAKTKAMDNRRYIGFLPDIRARDLGCSDWRDLSLRWD